MAAKNSAELFAPRKPKLGRVAFWGFLASIAVGAVASIVGAPLALIAMVVVLCLALVAVVMVLSWRRWQKTQKMPALLCAALSDVLRMTVQEDMVRLSKFERGNVLKVGPPQRIVLQDPMKRELPRQELEQAAGSALGGRYRVDAKRSKPAKTLVLSGYTPEPEPELTSRQEIEQRILKGAREVLGDSAQVTVEWDETPSEPDYLVSAEITGFNGVDIALPGKRNQAISRLRSRLPKGNFVPEADPQEDLIAFSRAKPLPKLVLPPAHHAPLLRTHTDYRDLKIPLGLAAGGVAAVWQLRKLPHMLAIGGTGGGKTICEHGVIQILTQAGCRVWLIDGKGVEFIGYRDWPNVEFLAQDVPSQVRLINLAHETMEKRYKLIRDGKAGPEDMDPIVIMIDELTSFKTMAEQLYRKSKSGGPAKSELMDWIGNLLRLARTCKIHIFIGMQRPDTTIIDGEARDNMGGRISLGPLSSKEGSLMMWDNAAIGVQIPRVAGRAVGLVDGVPAQIQATYNANPDPRADDYHPGMVAAARPAQVIYSRKTIGEPATDIDDKTGEETPPTWQDYLAAPILDANGDEIELNPVMTEESKAMRAMPVTEKPQPVELQEATGLEDIDQFFDPINTLRFGRRAARALRALYGRAETTHEDDDSLQLPPSPLQSGHTEVTEVHALRPGDRVFLDDLGQEIMLSSVDPSEESADLYDLEGYTDDGSPVSVQMEATANVEMSMADELAS